MTKLFIRVLALLVTNPQLDLRVHSIFTIVYTIISSSSIIVFFLEEDDNDDNNGGLR